MPPQVVCVSFITSIYKSKTGFQVPKQVCRLLGVDDGDRVAINIVGPSGHPLYDGGATLSSGTEICSGAARKALKGHKGHQITVWASRI